MEMFNVLDQTTFFLRWNQLEEFNSQVETTTDEKHYEWESWGNVNILPV